MARFLGTVQGNRGEAHRLGSAASGLTVDADGWGGGVNVNLMVDDDGNDYAIVWLSEGSRFGGPQVLLYSGKIDATTRSKLKARQANDVLFGGG